MVDECGRDQYSSTGREIDHKVQLFQIDLAAAPVIKFPPGRDGSQAVEKVVKVGVFVCNDPGAEIEGNGGENRIRKVVLQALVVLE